MWGEFREIGRHGRIGRRAFFKGLKSVENETCVERIFNEIVELECVYLFDLVGTWGVERVLGSGFW